MLSSSDYLTAATGGDDNNKLWLNGVVTKMTWPLVRCLIMSSSSSSSSASSSSYSFERHDHDQVDVSRQVQLDDGNMNDSSSPSMETPSQSPSTAVTLGIPGSTSIDNSASTSKRRRLDSVALALPCFEDKRLLNNSSSSPLRTSFIPQRRTNWSQDDELRLLQSFLEYTRSWRSFDIASFYDQEVDQELKLRFNKSQLVEKLRRLKRKYQDALSKKKSTRIEFCFKNPHDRATFEISQKIWGSTGCTVVEKVNNNVTDDKETTTLNLKEIVVKCEDDAMDNSGGDRLLRRPLQTRSQCCGAGLLKRKPAADDDCGSSKNRDITAGLIFELALNPIPLSFGGTSSETKFGNGDDKWKKQQILELEVYSKRLELVQEQVKTTLKELRSRGGS